MWPTRSFVRLKSSRSKMQTASLRPWRCARATSSASVSWSACRLPSPVSASAVRQPPDGAALPGRLDRRPRVAGDRLEGLEVAARDRRLLVAPEDGQEAEVAARRLERHGDRRPHGRRLRDPGRVVVRDPDGAHRGCRPGGRRPLRRRPCRESRRRGRRRPRAATPSTSTATVAPATPWSDAAASAQRASTSSRSSACPSDSTMRARTRVLAHPLDRRRELVARARPSARRSSRSPWSSRRSDARRARSTIAATMPAATSAATAARSARAAVLIGVLAALLGERAAVVVGRRAGSCRCAWPTV